MPPRFALLFLAATLAAQQLPIAGLAHVGFQVSDLEKARSFYTGVLGYEEAFDMKDASGKVTMAFFKINDEQYIEISPGLPPDQDIRFTHLAVVSPDLAQLRSLLLARGVAVSAIQKGRDGNINCGTKDPDGHRIEMVQYLPGSWHSNARGKFAGARRISVHLWHTGVTVANLDAAMAFYRDKLGFQEIWRGGRTDTDLSWINMRMPGPRGDYVEFMLHAKPPTRQQYGSMHHLCLEVPDIQAAWRTVRERGVPDEARYQPRVGRNRRRLLNLFDPDGTRTELMEAALVP